MNSTERQRALRINRPVHPVPTGKRLPIGPMRAFVEELMMRAEREDDGVYYIQAGVPDGALGPNARVSCLLGVDEKTLWRWRYTSVYILEGAADAALTNEGSRHLGDLWPEFYWQEAA